MQAHTSRISYADIKSIKERFFAFGHVFHIATVDRKFEIPAFLLPDTGSYEALREFSVCGDARGASAFVKDLAGHAFLPRVVW
jgi:hypothetical protein